MPIVAEFCPTQEGIEGNWGLSSKSSSSLWFQRVKRLNQTKDSTPDSSHSSSLNAHNPSSPTVYNFWQLLMLFCSLNFHWCQCPLSSGNSSRGSVLNRCLMFSLSYMAWIVYPQINVTPNSRMWPFWKIVSLQTCLSQGSWEEDIILGYSGEP